MRLGLHWHLLVFMSISLVQAHPTTRNHTTAAIKSILIEHTAFLTQNGKRIEGTRYRNSHTLFDREGRIKRRIQYNHNGSFSSKSVYIYTSSGQIAEIRTYDSRRRLQSVEIYVYYAGQNRAEITSYADGLIDEDSITSKYAENYDVYGNVITVENLLGENGPYVEERYKYDSEGNEIELTRYRKAEDPFMRKVREYDDEGNVTKVQFFRGNGEYIGEDKYTYEFDAYGNWIKQVRWHDGEGSDLQPGGVTYRKIEYYRKTD